MQPNQDIPLAGLGCQVLSLVLLGVNVDNDGIYNSPCLTLQSSRYFLVASDDSCSISFCYSLNILALLEILSEILHLKRLLFFNLSALIHQMGHTVDKPLDCYVLGLILNQEIYEQISATCPLHDTKARSCLIFCVLSQKHGINHISFCCHWPNYKYEINTGI